MKHKFSAKQKRYMKQKRTLDFILSCGACIVLSPVLLILCIAIKIDSRADRHSKGYANALAGRSGPVYHKGGAFSSEILFG